MKLCSLILVDNMPPSCSKCMFYEPFRGKCIALGVYIWDDYSYQFPDNNRLEICPLEAPRKIMKTYYVKNYKNGIWTVLGNVRAEDIAEAWHKAIGKWGDQVSHVTDFDE